MTGILAHILAQERKRITPGSVNDVFAIAAAGYVGDLRPDSYPKYQHLASSYPFPALAAACKRLVRLSRSGAPKWQLLEEELKQTAGSLRSYPPVMGIHIERRVIAIVQLDRWGIERVEKRELGHDLEGAIKTTIAFFTRFLPWYARSTAALELPGDRFPRRSELTKAACQVLREAGVPIWDVKRPALLASFGIPPPKTLAAVRRSAYTIFPALQKESSKPQPFLDAAALALYVAIARYLDPEIGSTGTISETI